MARAGEHLVDAAGEVEGGFGNASWATSSASAKSRTSASA
jgi:hypothetical protein